MLKWLRSWFQPRKKLVIDRSKWRCHNHGLGATLLLNQEGFMCCLGQVSKQLGASDEQIRWHASPCKSKFQHPLLVDGVADTKLSNKAIEINDAEYYDDVSREQKLVELFADAGVEIVFEGEYHVQKTK